MRIIIEDTIAQGIVPILGTKADNFEGDNSINADHRPARHGIRTAALEFLAGSPASAEPRDG